MNKYTITMNEEQAILIKKSLDLYSRIQMGQLEELTNVFSGPLSEDLLKIKDKTNLEKTIKELKKEIFPELNEHSGYGITNEKRPDTSRQAYDILQVIRNCIAWTNNPNGTSCNVDFDSPMKTSKIYELPTIELIEKSPELLEKEKELKFEVPSDSNIISYTDGACSGNPGPGGWGSIILFEGPNGEKYEQIKTGSNIKNITLRIGGGETLTTNNRMELTAIIKTLETINNKYTNIKTVKIVSDSKYCVDGITQWMDGWIKKDFKKVKNVDLWKDFLNLRKILKDKGIVLDFNWVKGHNGDKYNEIADELATTNINT